MIFVRDKGRMCNNILQYAHVYAWAKEHGRKTVSMRFAYKYQYFKLCKTKWHWFWVYALAKLCGNLKLLPVASFHSPTDDQAHDYEVLQSCKWVIVEGWYFREYEALLMHLREIKELFAFLPEIEDSVTHYFCKHGDDDCIRLGVHVRRGDYKTWKGGRYYYEDATFIEYIRQFATMHPGKRIVAYVCGNDPSIDQKYYADELSGIADVYFPDGNPGEDLCLLSHCNYLIGAPSTFTLVASMYHDVPLCWMYTSNASDLNKTDAFGHFNDLVRKII